MKVRILSIREQDAYFNNRDKFIGRIGELVDDYRYFLPFYGKDYWSCKVKFDDDDKNGEATAFYAVELEDIE